MNLIRCFQIYKSIAEPFTIFSTSMSTIIGFHVSSEYADNSIKYLTNVGGYSSIGIIAGLIFPISIPLLACNLYNDKKNK